MKKALNESTIANELRGASAFFSGARQSEQVADTLDEQSIDRSDDRTVKRSVHRSDTPTTGQGGTHALARDAKPQTLMDEVQDGTVSPVRATERYAFEIYTDQKKLLNRIRYLYEEKTGKKLPASRILREAIEPYLKELEDQLSKP